MTLLQAAAAASDIEMCLMLKNYLSPEEFATDMLDHEKIKMKVHVEKAA